MTTVSSLYLHVSIPWPNLPKIDCWTHRNLRKQSDSLGLTLRNAVPHVCSLYCDDKSPTITVLPFDAKERQTNRATVKGTLLNSLSAVLSNSQHCPLCLRGKRTCSMKMDELRIPLRSWGICFGFSLRRKEGQTSKHVVLSALSLRLSRLDSFPETKLKSL